ncbi:MAG: DNA integrity scanning protein DisA [Ilumatobacter coccineus]|uniref:DNA integrity scanning protein DisA n=1 Tax=Ilumatobacter coccineus TaxID=467094 RepID=A0A2G6KFF3_9ACTN|nr:MAG: DNA integrity scanning protein DisA [Ilumatobacter coccineus]
MTSTGGANKAMRYALSRTAPGTPLRDGIDRVVRAQTGALVVLSDNPEVLSICTGGFLVDAPFSPQRLSELAKMDGAIIVSNDGGRIARANVHLVPDPSVPTSETGTRHRTAERVARSLNVPVVTASEEMGVINIYAGGDKRQLLEIGQLLDRANQALQTLERYKVRLNDALSSLTTLEIEDIVTVRDVIVVVQRGEMVRRISEEIETMVIELGVDARLLRLQLDELASENEAAVDLVIADYLPPYRQVAETLADIAALRDDDVLDARRVISTFHLGELGLGDEVTSRGIRMLDQVPALGSDTASRVADDIGGLSRLQRATTLQLMEVDGVDETLATQIKKTFERITESTILKRYN